MEHKKDKMSFQNTCGTKMKVCTKCGIEKDFEKDFYKFKKKYVNKKGETKIYNCTKPECKKCIYIHRRKVYSQTKKGKISTKKSNKRYYDQNYHLKPHLWNKCMSKPISAI